MSACPRLEFGIPIQGDSTSDELLRLAGVERARALIVVLPSDSDNLYITLSARVLNAKLFIISRAEGEGAEAKLRRVGANEVIAPYVLTGHRMVQTVLRPTVGHLMERAFRPGMADYQIEEVLIESGSVMCGKTLAQSKMHEELGIIVLMQKKVSGEFVYNPKSNAIMEAGTILVVVGARPELKVLEKRSKGSL